MDEPPSMARRAAPRPGARVIDHGDGNRWPGSRDWRGAKNPKYRHGLRWSREYVSWLEMRWRCLSPKCKHYANYGGRGITICDRWSSFVNFLADMGARPDGTSLDRIDNAGNYEPSNCRWGTRTEQARNRRNVRLTMERAEDIRARASRGEKRKDLAAEFGVSLSLVRAVLERRVWN